MAIHFMSRPGPKRRRRRKSRFVILLAAGAWIGALSVLGGDAKGPLDAGEPAALSPPQTPQFLRNLTLQAEADVLWASGILLEEYRGEARWEKERYELGIQFAHTGFDLDYKPNIFGFDTGLQETRRFISGDISFPIHNRIRLNAAVAGYDGFSDYRSLWISQWYEQLVGEVSGYVEPGPEGYSLSAGLRWEYIPLNAWLELSAAYGKDVIAPAYDFTETGLQRAEDELFTESLNATFENVLHSRIITQTTLRWNDTTNREDRWSVANETHFALFDRWVLRTQIGAAVEDPNFDAYYYGAALDWEFAGGFYAGVSARFYADTGEIENSLGGFNSSAPELNTFEFGLSLRWQGDSTSAKLYAGYLESDYSSLSEDNVFLGNLYRDREWGVFQFSVSHQF
ncbi:MAG TPA: hypothetical protein VMN36_00410 [Verrucomicrobiales bacterium]|nr:hypothetical protein [Verrucomicrobiales bacterium]